MRKREIEVEVTCSLKVSTKCLKTFNVHTRSRDKNLRRNGGKFVCHACKIRDTKSGANNGNSSYDINHDFFKQPLTKEAAYFLGWIASDGYVASDYIFVGVHSKDFRILETLIDLIFLQRKPKVKFRVKQDLCYFLVSSQRIVSDVCLLLGITPGNKSHTVMFPEVCLKDHTLTWAFIRGLMDGDGSLCPSRLTPKCCLTSMSSYMKDSLEEVSTKYGISFHRHSREIEWSCSQAVLFLKYMYEDRDLPSLERKYYIYHRKFEYWSKVIDKRTKLFMGTLNICKVNKTRTDAVIPAKSHPSDVGWDVTLVEKISENGPFEYYDTGIRIDVSPGWYFDLIARSSLHKSGRLLSNQVGVLDPNYRGTIIVSLLKIDENAEDLKLPFRAAQLVPRIIPDINLIEVTEFSIETDRGEGGFGSTNVSEHDKFLLDKYPLQEEEV